MYSMYSKLMDQCEKDSGYFHKYRDRLKAIVDNTEGIGWGFHDGLIDLYYSLDEVEDS